MTDNKIFKVYKITCNITGFTYVGRTSTSLKLRIQKHASAFKKWQEKWQENNFNWSNIKGFCSSFIVLCNNNYKSEVIISCEDYKTSRFLEYKFIKKLNCVNYLLQGDGEISENRKFYQKKYYKKKKVLCECGTMVNKYYLPKHLLTKKHVDLVKTA